jgi:hypothetical protein
MVIQHHYGYPAPLWLSNTTMVIQHHYGYPAPLWLSNTTMVIQHHYGYPTYWQVNPINVVYSTRNAFFCCFAFHDPNLKWPQLTTTPNK